MGRRGAEPGGRLRAVALAGIAAVLTAACSATSAGPGPSAATASPAAQQLVVWDAPDSHATEAAMRTLLDHFEVEHPQITVRYEPMDAQVLRGRFDTAAKSASGVPDVLRLPTEWTSDFAGKGYLLALDGLLPADVQDDIVPAAQAAATFDGRLYSAPQTTDTLALVVDKTLLAGAKLPVPRTWADVVAAAGPLTAYGIRAFDTSFDGYHLLPFIYSAGGQLLNPSTKQVLISQPAAVAGLTLRVGIPAPPASQMDAQVTQVDPFRATAVRSAFSDGVLAMTVDSLSALPLLTRGRPADSVVAVPLPPGSTGQSVAPVGGDAVAVYAGTTAPSAASLLTAYLTSAAAQAALTSQAGLLPSLSSVLAQPLVTADPFLSVYAKILLTAQALPPVQGAANLLYPLGDALKACLVNGTDPQAALNDTAVKFASSLTYTIAPAP
ncbi:MAG TPA: extracellular solute-binding protein [Actinomycetes bacterium]